MPQQSSQRDYFSDSANDNADGKPALVYDTKSITKKRDQPPPPPSDPDAPVRKFRAKRINEYVKATYSVSNTLAAATIVTAYIVPELKREPLPQELDRPMWVAVGLTIFLFGLAVIRLGYQRED